MQVIKIYSSKKMPKMVRQRIFERSGNELTNVVKAITPLIKEVEKRGDEAVLDKYARRQIPIKNLKVSRLEILDAEKRVSSGFIAAFEQTRENITAVCTDQLTGLRNQKVTTLLNGNLRVWRKWLPEETVGIYAPGGRANYPSTVLMCAIPALVAGCQRLVLTVPPQADGTLPPELLVVADRLGISDIFKVGGAQAIAALAYGTQTIPRARLVVGPGNQYVTAAKVALFPQIRIDSPAGPSENLIIADEKANPAWVAADLITDCEHGPDSTGIVVTDSKDFAVAVQKEIELQVATLSTCEVVKESLKQYGAIIVTKDLAECVELANEYAPEHLQIMTNNPLKIANKITAAGSVFIGPFSSKAAGDYATGANHVLPTGGQARSFGPLSVETFGRFIEFQELDRNGLTKLQSTIQNFADVERLPAHKQSALIRCE
ncbi:MAG: histidinol dehydrogenase [Candidatus Pacebacteria bacterium CG_4_10_14_0_8_um_filter_42_14]|nr:MAG: histidinol dehydrogenase [Candidatus Pacebacteria bacterium CG_4_10_14_0_8_um_filter_42_14]